jgi:hypothetical protein
VNIDKDKWLQFDRARNATGSSQFSSDEDTLKADGDKHIALVRMVARRKEKEKGDDR